MSRKKLTVYLLAFSVLTIATVIKIYADTTADLLPVLNGFYSAWTASSGSSTLKYTLVDETSCNGNTDYIYTTATNNRESFSINLSSVPNGSAITAIEITPCASNHLSGSGTSNVNVFYRLNGSDSGDDGEYYLSGTTPTDQVPYEFLLIPNIKNGSTTLQSGFVFVSGSKGARVSRLSTKITYTSLNAPSNLTANASGTIKNLSWTDNSEYEDGFAVESSFYSTSSFSQIGTVGSNITTYTNSNNATGTIYYRVRAYNSGGSSSYSNVASVTVF
ncbi:MAG: hypothetical protein HY093_00765 [Candidatus Liptonbacteria bacterium]|nr:hypothetical protein [Candidatus Liptonbacteria bacterium]